VARLQWQIGDYCVLEYGNILNISLEHPKFK